MRKYSLIFKPAVVFSFLVQMGTEVFFCQKVEGGGCLVGRQEVNFKHPIVE